MRTFREQGIDYTYTLWLDLLLPKETPQDFVDRLSDALPYATSDK